MMENTSLKENDSNLISRTRIGNMIYLTPQDILCTDEGLHELRQAIEQCIAKIETQVVIDLIKIKTINSKSLEAFLNAQNEMIKLGGWLKVTQANPLIDEIFTITNFFEYISVIGSNSSHFSQQKVKPSQLRLGDILIEQNLLTTEQLSEALKLQKTQKQRIGQIFIEQDWVKEDKVLSALSQQLSIPFIALKPGLYDLDIATKINKSVITRLNVLPLFKVHGFLSLATSDPQAIPNIKEIEKIFGCRVRPILVQSTDITKSINHIYSSNSQSSNIFEEVDSDFSVVENVDLDTYATIDEIAADSPIINLVNSIIQKAVKESASDIHLEISQSNATVRFRVDGVLHKVMSPKPETHLSVVSRLKVMANLDIAERRMPQDGRIQIKTQGRSIDLRFSSLPGLYGEKIVLRVLDKEQAILDVDKIGMRENNLNNFKKLLGNSFGLILVTGPTGSGKTTTLYSALNHINSVEKNIVTIEDPVEYQIEIINQNEVKENIGLTFSKTLKHVLRQDPDIIMIGEIRDSETAKIAIHAALTGHLVLSTLHTNDSAGAVTRLIDMGVEPFLLSSALIGVVAQRLVRTICPACKTSFIPPSEIVNKYKWNERQDLNLSKGTGCPECYDTGYKGRMGVHELLMVDEDFQKLIISNPNRDELNAYLERSHTKTLLDDVLERVVEGKTTIESISRVINL